MRKGPPYKIENGLKGQQPPAYVQYIGNGKITLGGDLNSINLDAEISYQDNGEAYENNPNLVALMIELNNKGVAFCYDYKVHMSPHDLMAILQDKGILKKEYREIAWSDRDKWYIRFHEIV